MKKNYFKHVKKQFILLLMAMFLSLVANATLWNIPNTVADTLEHFFELHYGTLWQPGDTIILTSNGEYIVNGTIDIYQEVTIMGDPALSACPVLHLYDNGFRPQEDSINVTIKNLNFNGYDEVEQANAPFVLRFKIGSTYWKNIILEDIEAWAMKGFIDLDENKHTVYDSVIINNVVCHDFVGNEFILDPNINYAKYLSITNSTFYNIQGGFIANPDYLGNGDTLINKNWIIDHNTFYNVCGVGNRSLIQINDPVDGSVTFTFTNNIVSKLYDPTTARPFRINALAGDFTISNSTVHDFISSYQDYVHNLDDVAALANVTVTKVSDADPGFANPGEGDFNIPKGSALLTAGTDDGPIGDPEWTIEAVKPYEPGIHTHLIPNTDPDTLEHFMELYYDSLWFAGDTILLTDPSEYTVVGTIDIYGEVTVMGDPRLSVKPTLLFVDNGFRPKEDSISVVLKGFNAIGWEPVDSSSMAGYLLRFDQNDFKNYNNVVVEDIEAWGFTGGIQLYKGKGSEYESLTVNNVIFHDMSNQLAIDLGQNKVKYVSVTNSTFYNIQKGIMGEFWDVDTVYYEKEMIIEHNTFYNCIDGGTMFAIHNIQDSSVTVSFKNNIVSKLFNYDNARPFRIDSTAGEIAIEYNALHNFITNRAGDFNVDSLLDYPNVTISNNSTDNPGFADAENYNFSLFYGSPLLTAGSDGGPIGDPRWVPEQTEEPYVPGIHTHLIPNSDPDTLEHFMELYYDSLWFAGDTILLVSPTEYIVTNTVDIYGEVTVLGDPRLSIKPTLLFVDNGFRLQEDSISIVLKGFNAIGWEPVDSSSRAGYLLRFDQTGFKNYNDIIVENIEAWGFQGGIQLYKSKGSEYESLTVNNVIFHDMSNQLAIDLGQNKIKYVSVTNSTFYNIQKGIMGEFWDVDTVFYEKEMVIEHNTFYNCIDGGTMFAIHNIQDSSVTVSFKNNIASKLFNYDNARPFRIDSTAGEVAIEYNALHNFNTNRAGDFNVDSLLDYPNVTISNIYTFNPQFKDTNGYFMLPDTSSLLIAGSDGGPIGDPRWIPQVGVTIREITERVVEGSDVQLIADVVLSEGSDLTVTWSVTNNYDGTTGTATINSSTGLLSALTPGKVLVTATSNHNPAISGTLVVTIDELVLVTSITLSAVDASGDPSTSITNKGGFLTITAVIAPGNADDKSIEWSVSDTNLATINEKTATTAELIAKLSGTVYAIASAKDGSGIKDSIEITISGQTPVESVTVSSTGGVTEITTKGGTLQMIATVLPENADIKEVTWSVDDESVATISSTGLLTAVADGEVTVTARATDGTFKSGTMDITISGQTVGILSATNAEIMVVPNPATDFITIKTNEESEVTIYNVLGEIELIKLIDPNGTINVSYLKSGLYFVNVKIGDEVKTARLIIK